jgi:hypothetical protein
MANQRQERVCAAKCCYDDISAAQTGQLLRNGD